METQVQTIEQKVQATTPDQLLALAINKDLDIDKLERLLAMKERWDKEEAKKAFTEALTAFQEECPDLRKTKKVSFEMKSGGYTEYHYAPLGDIDRQIKPLLKKHGFAKSWKITQGEKIKVICVIEHIGGHEEERAEMESAADMSGSKNPIQGAGSAIEYMKRYTLIAALGLTTADQDIDGRMPELDIDKLHKQYMELYDKICAKDPAFRSPGDPDNWKGDRTPHLYVQAIGKARQLLAKLTA